MFRLVVKRNRRRWPAPAEQLLEVITPRTNAALITPAENLVGSISLHTTSPDGGPVALEIVADGERSRSFVRRKGPSSVSYRLRSVRHTHKPRFAHWIRRPRSQATHCV
jgi:hypothetical protein